MTTICCNRCLEDIARLDSKAVEIWLEICAAYAKYEGIIQVRENRIPWIIPQMKMLETYGYITTADCADAVMIRVEGFGVFEDEDATFESFCIKRDEHQKHNGQHRAGH